jgi:hypothetical protein
MVITKKQTSARRTSYIQSAVVDWTKTVFAILLLISPLLCSRTIARWLDRWDVGSRRGRSMEESLQGGMRWFLFIIFGFCSMLGFAVPFGRSIGNYLDLRERNRAIEAMTAIGADVPDEQYLNILTERYRKVSYPIEQMFRHDPERAGQNNETAMRISFERSSDSSYKIQLRGNLRFRLRVEGDPVEGPYDDIGESAGYESSMLLTLVLALASSRAAHINEIQYLGADQNDSGAHKVVYEVLIRPGDYSAHKLEYPSFEDFVKSSKQVLHDTASSTAWRFVRDGATALQH